MKMIEKIENEILNKNILFFNIEKKIIEQINLNNKNFDLSQLNFEIQIYSRNVYKNNKLFFILKNLIYNNIDNYKLFSIEIDIVILLLELNKKLFLKYEINFCYKEYTSELISNWILLSFNTTLLDRSYFEKKEIFFNRYDCVDRFSNMMYLYLIFYDTHENEFCLLSKKINKKLKAIAFSIFNFLIENKIIIKVTRRLKIKKIKNVKNIGTKTFIFFKINNLNLVNNFINYSIFLKKPTCIQLQNIYFYGGFHYFSLNSIFKTNLRSDKIFEIGNLNLVDKFTSLKYIIDWDFYEIIYNLICENLEKVLNVTIDQNIKENSNNIKDFIMDHLNNIFNSTLYEKIENELELNNNLDKSKNLNKNFNELLLYYLFINLKYDLKDQNINEFYLTLNFDFRGRIYTKSCISPIGPKIFRYLYYYGYYSENELLIINQLNFKNTVDNKILLILEKCSLLKLYNNIDIGDNIQFTYMYWCVFEIGKIFKNKLTIEKDGKFSDYDLIQFGLEMIDKITNKIIFLDFNEKLEYSYIISCLKNLNEKKFKKLIIYKDATASGIQLLTITLKPKNEEIAKNCNLDSNNIWYDTYYYIIKLFKNEKFYELYNICSDFDVYIKRNFLKSSIMTYMYGASEKTALAYYFENLYSNLDKDIGKKIFILFYKFLIELFKGDKFFKNPLSIITELSKQEFKKNTSLKLYTSDNCVVHMNYYFILKYRLDRRFNKIRNTITYTDLTEFPDEIKTFRSLLANVTQSLDATLVRLIISELNEPIITIHDCFGIDILNIPILIDKTNFSINWIFYNINKIHLNVHKDNYKTTFYSKHILL